MESSRSESDGPDQFLALPLDLANGLGQYDFKAWLDSMLNPQLWKSNEIAMKTLYKNKNYLINIRYRPQETTHIKISKCLLTLTIKKDQEDISFKFDLIRQNAKRKKKLESA